jgi:hypothetical protein
VELSATGALLEVESILGIPQQFHLRVAGKSSRASPDGKRWRLGRKSDSEAKYSNVNPSRNDGKTVHRLTVKGDVPVDGFWSTDSGRSPFTMPRADFRRTSTTAIQSTI